MRVPHFIAVLCLAAVSTVAFMNYGTAKQEENLSDTQRDEINKMIRAYILANPEIIPEAVEVLRARQNAAALMRSQDLLYNDGYSYVAGNENGDITIVEFYDYNCGYCKQVPGMLARLMEEDKNLRVIFKELPILAESSVIASKAAMAAMRQDKFIEFHNAMMKNNRRIDEELILNIATDLGMDEELLIKDMADPEIEANLQLTDALVRNIGISGTPGFVIGTEIVAGFRPYEELKQIIAEQREINSM